jgi:hypothetical protein
MKLEEATVTIAKVTKMIIPAPSIDLEEIDLTRSLLWSESLFN